MFITATEVTILSNISATAGTIVAGGYIDIAEERLSRITNNWFVTDLYVQGGLAFNATARTITYDGISWVTEGFQANDIVYIYGSYRNDKYVKVLSVSSSVMTCVTGTTVVSELSGASILVSLVSFPNALKYTLAQMVKYDMEDRKNVGANIKSRTLGPWSETYKDGNTTDSRIDYGYPSDIIGQLAPYTIIGSY